MWEKQLLCFLPPPYEAIEIRHAEQKNREDRRFRKDLQKKKAKAETSKALSRGGKKPYVFVAKWQIGGDCTWRFKLRGAHKNHLVPPKRIQHKLPKYARGRKEGKSVKHVEGFFLQIQTLLCLYLLSRKERRLPSPVKAMASILHQYLHEHLQHAPEELICNPDQHREQHHQISMPPFMNRC